MSVAPDQQPSASSMRVMPPQLPPVDVAMGRDELRRRRFASLILALGSGALLAVAWGLRPASAGFGTHEALGLPPCSWPSRFGLPCPSCGMTTSFAHAAKGNLLASFAAQPMGCILAILTGMVLVGSLWTLATGRTVWPVYERLWNARGLWLLGLAALLAWGYKIALMRGWME
jgi:hypothetical protein